MVGEVLDFEDAQGVVAAGDPGAGAQSDDLGDHNVGGGQENRDAEQGERRPGGQGAVEGRGDPPRAVARRGVRGQRWGACRKNRRAICAGQRIHGAPACRVGAVTEPHADGTATADVRTPKGSDEDGLPTFNERNLEMARVIQFAQRVP
jgi:hypothetical protein